MRRTHTYRTKLFATIAAGALTISLAACSNDSEEETTATSAAESATSEAQDDGQWPRTITTLNGNGEETEVTIESKPENIVSTSVTLTGGLLAIDAPVKATGTVNNRAPLANQDGFFTRWADEAESKGVKSIYVGEPNVEAVLAEAPDLVIISSAGQDSAIDLYDQLADTVPTVVIDYSKQSWEETAEQLGEATGNEKGAEDAIKRYEDRVEEVKNAINAPEQPVNIVSLAQEGGGLNFWTKDSAQGRILTDLGFEVAQPDESLVDTSSNFAKRKDTRPVSAENVAPALTGLTVFALNADGKQSPSEVLKENPQLATVPAVESDSVYDLQPDTFRIDYFSAMNFLDEIEAFFGK